jgi:fucose permease
VGVGVGVEGKGDEGQEGGPELAAGEAGAALPVTETEPEPEPEPRPELKEEEIARQAAGRPPLPLLARLLLTAFFFVYVGTECAYGAWVTTFALRTGATDSQDQAAFCAAIFWAALAFGRVLAIPLAVYFTTTALLRAQLALTVVGSLLTVTLAHQSYQLACGASAVLGFALSSIFPLAMMLALDYGRAMDGATTSMFVVGSTFGEGVVPVCLGLAMEAAGPQALPYCVCACTAAMVGLYVAVHALLSLSQQGDEQRNEYLAAAAVDGDCPILVEVEKG